MVMVQLSQQPETLCQYLTPWLVTIHQALQVRRQRRLPQPQEMLLFSMKLQSSQTCHGTRKIIFVLKPNVQYELGQYMYILEFTKLMFLSSDLFQDSLN